MAFTAIDKVHLNKKDGKKIAYLLINYIFLLIIIFNINYTYKIFKNCLYFYKY